MKQKIKRPKKKFPILKRSAQTLIYGTPIATLVSMGVKVWVNDTPTLSFLDNFTFQISFWSIIAGLVIVPVYYGIVRKRLRDKMLLQEANDGYVAPKFRLLQAAQYGISMGLLIAFIYMLRFLASDEMLTFLGISGASGLVGYGMLIIDSVNKQTNVELDKIQKL